MVVNYINKKWEPCHVIVEIFEVHETLKATMAIQLKDLVTQYNLWDKVITYVKDEGVNLNTPTTALTSIGLGCQYVTNDLKVCGSVKEGSIKEAQSSFQKTITSTEKSGKGIQE
jgi:hypothetical protein